MTGRWLEFLRTRSTSLVTNLSTEDPPHPPPLQVHPRLYIPFVRARPQEFNSLSNKLEQSERAIAQNKLRPADERVEPVLKGDEFIIAKLDRLLHPHALALVAPAQRSVRSEVLYVHTHTDHPHTVPTQLPIRGSCAAEANTFDEYSREATALGEEHPMFWEKRGEKRTLVWRRKWRHLQDNTQIPRGDG